ncbi:MAG TPA: hypothetical protein PKY82_29280 [Pyrinomonadaceae bacterium]|nr:hypothetical protein [Pyrinomonadaceae bacterium]
MKHFLLFLLAYSKMRISVTFGIRTTSYQLYIKWWQHQRFLKLTNVYIG